MLEWSSYYAWSLEAWWALTGHLFLGVSKDLLYIHSIIATVLETHPIKWLQLLFVIGMTDIYALKTKSHIFLHD